MVNCDFVYLSIILHIKQPCKIISKKLLIADIKLVYLPKDTVMLLCDACIEEEHTDRI